MSTFEYFAVRTMLLTVSGKVAASGGKGWHSADDINVRCLYI